MYIIGDANFIKNWSLLHSPHLRNIDVELILMKNVVVFAGNECVKEREDYYYRLAYDTGIVLAKNGFVTITGGGPGLMNEVMRGAVSTGGKTIAVCLEISGRKHTLFATEKTVYHSLSDRQNKLLSLGEAFISLPGGIGTLFEITQVLAMKRKEEISRDLPLILIGNPHFSNFNSLIRYLNKDGFVPPQITDFYRTVDNPQQAVDLLNRYNKK